MKPSFETAPNLSPYGSVEKARAAHDAEVEREWKAKNLASEPEARAALESADFAAAKAEADLGPLETAVARALGAVEDLEGQLSARHEQLRQSQNRQAETLAAASGPEDAQSVASANAETQIAEACLTTLKAKLSGPLAQTRAAVSTAKAALEAAKDTAAFAKYGTLRAAVEHRFVQLAAPMIEEAEGLFASLTEAAPPGADARGDVKRLREKITRTLNFYGAVPDEALQGFGRLVRPSPSALAARARASSTETSVDEMVDAIVAPGNTYGDAPAGSRVRVTAEELASQIRRSPMDGHRVGALMTIEEHEQSIAKIEARKPSLLARGKSMTERGWETIRAAMDTNARAKEAAELERAEKNAAGLADAAKVMASAAFDREYARRARQVESERETEREIERANEEG